MRGTLMQIKIISEFIRKSVSPYLFVITVMASALCHSTLVYGQTADEFLTELFSPVELIKFGIVTPQQYPQLTELDKENLLKAKAILIEFLKSFNQRDIDPLDYLHPAIRKKYKDRPTLYQQEFGYAESLLEIKIFNFLLKGQNKDEIVFYAALTDTSEGEDRSYQTAFALKKFRETWKISRFVGDIKYWEKELKQ